MGKELREACSILQVLRVDLCHAILVSSIVVFSCVSVNPPILCEISPKSAFPTFCRCPWFFLCVLVVSGVP